MAAPQPENRGEQRFDHFLPIQVKDLGSGETYEARLLNYSNSGISFESNGAFEPGARIYICIQKSPYKNSPGILEYLYGEVMWRRDLNQAFTKYGYGIQLVSGSNRQGLEAENSKSGKELRSQPRKPYCKTVQFSSSKGVHEGKTINVSASGVFIVADEKLEVGQELKMNLPLGEGKTAEIIGHVVWANDKGFGLKFQKVK